MTRRGKRQAVDRQKEGAEIFEPALVYRPKIMEPETRAALQNWSDGQDGDVALFHETTRKGSDRWLWSLSFLAGAIVETAGRASVVFQGESGFPRVPPDLARRLEQDPVLCSIAGGLAGSFLGRGPSHGFRTLVMPEGLASLPALEGRRLDKALSLAPSGKQFLFRVEMAEPGSAHDRLRQAERLARLDRVLGMCWSALLAPCPAPPLRPLGQLAARTRPMPEGCGAQRARVTP